MRILAELELIEMVRRTQRRGAIEHYYRAVPRPEATVNLELALDDAGWEAVASAIGGLGEALAEISARHPGAITGRAVATCLMDEA